MKKIYVYLAAVCIGTAACTNDEHDSVLNDNMIRLNTAVGELTRAAGNLLEGNFAEDTPIKVQVTDKAETDPVSYDAAVYTADGEGGLSAATPQYYPVSGSLVDIYAYYPASASTEENGFSVATDQASAASGDANYKASDLMWAKIEGVNKESSAEARTLSFGHKLSKLVVTLTKGTVSDDELAAATVTLKGVILKGTFTPATGLFTAASAETEGATGDITVAENAAATAHAAVVVPQSMVGKKLGVTINGNTAYYPFADDVTFAPGKVYDLTVTVNKTGLSVSTTISNWGTDEGWTDPEPSLTF